MKRQYFLRGRLVEVDQIDNVVAVQRAPSDGRAARSFGQAAESEIQTAGERAGLRSMREDGERLIASGITSEEEVLRVTRE